MDAPAAMDAIVAMSSGFVAAALTNVGNTNSPRCRLCARSSVMAMRWPPSTTLERVVPPRTAYRVVSGTLLAPHRATRSASIMANSTCLPALTHSP